MIIYIIAYKIVPVRGILVKAAVAQALILI